MSLKEKVSNSQESINLKALKEKVSNSQEYTNLKEPYKEHIAVVNVFDTSYSMLNNIAALENAYKEWIREANANPSEVNMIDVATIEYNTGVYVIHEFKPLSELSDNFSLKATGITNTGDALVKAIELCRRQTDAYLMEGIESTSWIILYTDGIPTQDMSEAKRLLDEAMKKVGYGCVKLWIVATDNADIQWCRDFTDKVIKMDDHNYKAMFDWTCKSEGLIMSKANPLVGTLQLPPTPMNTKIELL